MKKISVDLCKVITLLAIAAFVVASFCGCIYEEYVYFVPQKGLEGGLGTIRSASNCGWLMLVLGVIECIMLKRCSKGSLILGQICAGGGILLTIMMPDVYAALNKLFPIFGGLGYYRYSHTSLGYVAIGISGVIFICFAILLKRTHFSSKFKRGR